MALRSPSHSGFANTRWSLVAALRESGPDGAHKPLLELCLHNWYPVYSYLRRCGHAPAEAQERTREFFDYLLREGAARAAGSEYGRFREFLVAELHAYLKRERPVQVVTAPLAPMSIEQLEARQAKDNANAGSPEQALRRGFALGIIGNALKRLRGEAQEAERLAMFEALERFLTSEPLPGEFDAIARELSVRPLFVVMAVRRLRERFVELIDDELGDTVLNTDELAAERQALQHAMGLGVE
jgi:hypothetical protein